MNARSILLSIALAALVAFGPIAAAPAARPAAGAHPVVVPESDSVALLLGGTVDGKWVSASRIAPRLRGREEYWLYSRAKLVGKTTGSNPRLEQDDVYAVSLTRRSVDYQIGIAGSWNPIPRRAKAGNARDGTYAEAVKRFLSSKGLKAVAAHIGSVTLVDLQGDGHDEAIVSAQSADWKPWIYRKAQYSVVLLITKPGGKQQRTYVLSSEVHTKAVKDGRPTRYAYGGVWDIDGDGALEVCVNAYCERADYAGVEFYHWSKSGPKQICSVGLGH
jgi:hypothetical protein